MPSLHKTFQSPSENLSPSSAQNESSINKGLKLTIANLETYLECVSQHDGQTPFLEHEQKFVQMTLATRQAALKEALSAYDISSDMIATDD